MVDDIEEKKAVVAAVPRARWTNAMVESLLEMRFDRTTVSGRRFHASRSNNESARAWALLEVEFNARHGVSFVVKQLQNKLDDVKAVYKKALARFKETGNSIED